MADRNSRIPVPERYYGNAASDSAEIISGFHRQSEGILLAEFRGNRDDVIFSPFQARAEERVHLVRLGLCITQIGVQPLACKSQAYQFLRLVAGILVTRGKEHKRREVVIRLERQRFFKTRALALNRDSFS